MKVTDRVKLKFDPGDLRYPLPVGALGTITGGPYPDNVRNCEWYWVDWDDKPEDAAAMRMWPEELEVQNE